MTSEQEFLARVSARLGRKSPAEAKPVWNPTLPVANIGPTDPEALAERFKHELERVGGKVYRAAPTEAAATAAAILTDQGLAGTVVRWEDPSLNGLGLDEALNTAGFTVVPFAPGAGGGALVQAAEQAVAGITGCDAAIAETGSLVLGSRQLEEQSAPGRGRVVSLLPPVHIAIVRLEQLVYSALEVFRGLKSAPMPSQVVFVTGPSRSADIENDLSIGVHGPGQVHVILVG